MVPAPCTLAARPGRTFRHCIAACFFALMTLCYTRLPPYWRYPSLQVQRTTASPSRLPSRLFALLGCTELSPFLGDLPLSKAAQKLLKGATAPPTAKIKTQKRSPRSERLPWGGVLYRLGGLTSTIGGGSSSVPTNDDIRRRRSLLISAPAGASWDLLWDDYHGAFGQPMPPGGGALSIPWREPHQPLFLVLYNSTSSNSTSGTPARVRYVEQESGGGVEPPTPANGNVTTRAVTDCSVATEQLVRTAAALNSTDVFQYPTRRLFFRRRVDPPSSSSPGGFVTACVQMTVDRLPHLEDIAAHFAGPISAVLYVGFRGGGGGGGDVDEEIRRAAEFWDGGSDAVRRFVDLHLVRDDRRPWYATGSNTDNPYPINLLRQIAVDAATTEWIFTMEADMLTVPGAHQLLTERRDAMMSTYNESRRKGRSAAFAVPIYRAMSNMSTQIMPHNKTELVKKVQGRRNGHWSRYKDQSHTHIDYDGFESLGVRNATFLPYHSSGNMATVAKKYQEPYVIVRKGDSPPYNVLFWGMWQDKVTFYSDMSNFGFDFYIHPDLFMVNFVPTGENSMTWVALGKSIGWRQFFVLMMVTVYREEAQKVLRNMHTSSSI